MLPSPERSPRAGVPVYVGTYTDGASRGIYLVDFDPAGPSLSAPRLVAEAVNPTFFAWHPRRPILVAVSETDTVGVERAGGLLSYRVDGGGGLTPVGAGGTGGAGACHLSLDAAGRHVFVANYGAGSVAVLGIDDEGRVESTGRVHRHSGRGPHATRQTRAHAHAIHLAPGGRFVVAADLGADSVFVYRWDEVGGVLTPHAPALIKGRPGAGPRHIAFHPDGTSMFVVNELDGTVTAYRWDGEAGTLQPRSAASTLPPGWTGENTAAEVAVHPSGRFVYASNRGHDSIAVFAFQPHGSLVALGSHASGGRTPRHFAIEPSGRFLLAANQDSDVLTLFGIDSATGALSDMGVSTRVPSPVFVGFPPAGRREDWEGVRGPDAR